MATDPHQITNQEAIDLTKRWQKTHPGGFQAALFQRIAFDNLLAKPGAVGIRIYMGEKIDGEWTYVMVATDADDKDIFVPVTRLGAGDQGDDAEEDPMPCPAFCDCDSPLSDCP